MIHRPTELTKQLKAEALRLGFALSGVTPAVAPPGLGRFHEWLESGFAGTMRYLEDRRTAYGHPRHVLEGVRSVVMLAMPYRTTEPQPVREGFGRVSRYAWGSDYHDLIHDRLHALADWLRATAPGAKVRGVVDTAPLLEREFAQLAGLGWIGKNTLLLNRKLGSWFFLAGLLTDLELDYDAEHETDHCGTCTACLDACPTEAFVAPYVLDARKCISYTTIELRDEIPLELRAGHGNWVFGCDVCQDVCPWNRKAPTVEEPAFMARPDENPLNLIGLFNLDDAAFRRRFRDTPLWRARRRGILRNAAIVLGNQRAKSAVAALLRGAEDAEPLVREACEWALAQIGSD
ncbi:MAG: tRNA epoxyqueuosine(34) reductase QueG [Planctomycetales bacterium]|nr:tRNA epoxyqueuosine(34) reductase QueG [Planctomycetales bacterium]MBN8625909.1 tRNA epoxyqueuosine(34) reductase QueG [Planctomycetota bacterium]